MNIKERLQTLSKQLHLNDYEIAERIGVSPSAVCRWINGTRKPSASHLIMLTLKFPDHFNKDEVMKCIQKK